MFTALTDNFRLSVLELFNNKLRALLTVLGITIGIAAVVLLLSLGQGVQNYVTDQFEGLGTNTIRISAIPDSNRRTESLTMELAETLKDQERLPLIDLVMPQVSGNYAVAYGDNEFTVGVQGITVD
jgi:putative ABC transport system permease protein